MPGNKGLQHKNLKRYEQHFNLNEYFKFSFVRNPWERAVSQIEYLRTKAGAAIFSKETFKERLLMYCSTRKNIAGHDLGACQLDYLMDKSGKVSLDFIGRFESLNLDFNKICIVLGINPPLQLPHIFNSNRKLHYSKYYDEESIDWIRERFAKDIDYFGYKYERQDCDSIESKQ